MGNGMNKVLNGLYVGNYRDSKDAQQLDKYQITHIIAIHDSPRRLLPDKHYLCVMASDSPNQNLSQYFTVCNDFIHAARLREGNVLIHCLAGMSRSVTVAVAYIMTVTNLNWKDALKVVRAGRSVANPNIGFQTQLQEFETYRLSEERRRLKERFPSSALENLDRDKCMMALDNYQELLQNKHICEGNCVKGAQCPTGVCNMNSSRGLLRRRPSSALAGSRLKASSSVASGIKGPLSCPTSPKHFINTLSAPNALSHQRVSENTVTPTSSKASSKSSLYDANLESKQQNQLRYQQQQYNQSAQNVSSRSRSSTQLSANRSVHVRNQGREHLKMNTSSNLNYCLQNNARDEAQMPSKPTDSYSQTRSLPPSIRGSRINLSDSKRGSAIYLGCSAPRNSTLSLYTSYTYSDCLPPSNNSKRSTIKRTDSLMKPPPR